MRNLSMRWVKALSALVVALVLALGAVVVCVPAANAASMRSGDLTYSSGSLVVHVNYDIGGKAAFNGVSGTCLAIPTTEYIRYWVSYVDSTGKSTSTYGGRAADGNWSSVNVSWLHPNGNGAEVTWSTGTVHLYQN